MKKLSLFLAICTILNALPAYAKGHLFMVGGRQTPQIIKKFVEIAGGSKAKIVILPMASTDPLDNALYQKYYFEKAGVKNVSFVICDSLGANADSNLAVLDGAEAIFFTGGDQSLLTAALSGTKMLQRIREIYQNGGLVGGSSAGAAVMSKLMITGNELRNSDSSRAYIKIQKGNIEVKEGFGFVQTAIIDQHAVRRKRQNRLISLVLEHPTLVGMAIDESTAIIVNPDDICEVIGDYTVVVYDPTEAKDITTDKKDNLAGWNIRMHILKSGDRYDLKTRTVK